MLKQTKTKLISLLDKGVEQALKIIVVFIILIAICSLESIITHVIDCIYK